MIVIRFFNEEIREDKTGTSLNGISHHDFLQSRLVKRQRHQRLRFFL